ncbi:MAG: hypothetical protein ACKO7W_10355 [Elainella sp.]
MALTVFCLGLSFLFSFVSSAVLLSQSVWLMVLKLGIAVGSVLLFIRAVIQQGRQPIWTTLWSVAAVTAVLMLAYFMGYTPFDAGYVPFAAGYILALNVLVVGESAHRLAHSHPQFSLLITATVTLSGLGLGWLLLLVLRLRA